jgi:hypothetical protein
MPHRKRYIIDADVFITAKNRYYAFDICPAFWKNIIIRHNDGRVCSIDRVKGELLTGRKTEDLVVWVKKEVPESFFEDVDDEAIADKYSQIMLWSHRHPQYTDAAKAKFATGADGWLVAFGAIRHSIVVTNEGSAPNSKHEFKLPDVCQKFGVEHRDTFQMLRELAVCFK